MHLQSGAKVSAPARANSSAAPKARRAGRASHASRLPHQGALPTLKWQCLLALRPCGAGCMRSQWAPKMLHAVPFTSRKLAPPHGRYSPFAGFRVGLSSKWSGPLRQKLQNGRHQVGAQHRVAPLIAATPGPILEAVAQHDLAGLVLNAKLQLTDATAHRPSTTRLFPAAASPLWPQPAEHKAHICPKVKSCNLLRQCTKSYKSLGAGRIAR
jgi:hypothetical protein